MSRLLTGFVGMATAVAVLTLGFPAGAVAQRGDVTSCSESFDPYSVSDAILAACGMQKIPISSVTSDSDGSTVYTYNTAAGPITATSPPPSFHPATASPAERAKFGIPDEPSAVNPIAQQHWLDAMQKLHWAQPAPYLIAEPPAEEHYQDGANWGGYVDYIGGTNSTVNKLDGWWVEPYVGSGCGGGTASPWVGLSDYAGDHIAQDGTNIAWPGSNNHQAWIELYTYPHASSDFETNLPFYATPGQSFQAEVKYNGDYTVDFYLYNAYTGEAYDPMRASWPNPRTGYADYILERYGSTLNNFGSIQWTKALINGSGQQNVGNPLYSFYQEDSTGKIETENTGVQNSNGGFTTTFVACS